MNKIKAARIPHRAPTIHELPERLRAVLAVVYFPPHRWHLVDARDLDRGRPFHATRADLLSRLDGASEATAPAYRSPASYSESLDLASRVLSSTAATLHGLLDRFAQPCGVPRCTTASPALRRIS